MRALTLYFFLSLPMILDLYSSGIFRHPLRNLGIYVNIKAHSHCDGNGKFFQTFPYAVEIQLVIMITILVIAIAVMNGYWTHSWWQRQRQWRQNNENYAVAVAVWTSLKKDISKYEDRVLLYLILVDVSSIFDTLVQTKC